MMRYFATTVVAASANATVIYLKTKQNYNKKPGLYSGDGYFSTPKNERGFFLRGPWEIFNGSNTSDLGETGRENVCKE